MRANWVMWANVSLTREQPGLEGQLANIADAIAYNNHDIDDGYRAGLITIEQLREQPLFENQHRRVRERYPELEDRRLIYEIIRRMIGTVVTDLIETTRHNLEELQPESIDDVRKAPKGLVTMSDDIFEQHRSLKSFLHEHLYSHEQKLAMTRKVQAMVSDLFAAFTGNIDLMPAQFASSAARQDEAGKARIVADYIAGMTDRFAIAEHERLEAC